jgi:hypothetical protein
MGFEPTITASERAKTFHVLDRSATVTVFVYILHPNNGQRPKKLSHNDTRPLGSHSSVTVGALKRLRHLS